MKEEIDRALRILLSTDDYTLLRRGADWAEVTYVHNDPPHPVLTLGVRP